MVFKGLTILAPRDPAGYIGLAESALAAGTPDQAEAWAAVAVTAPHGRPGGLSWAMVVQADAMILQRRFADADAVLARAEPIAAGLGVSEVIAFRRKAIALTRDGSGPDPTANGAQTPRDQGHGGPKSVLKNDGDRQR